MNKASLTKTALPNGGELYKYDNGDKVYFLNRKIHRENGLAVKDINGTKEWWINGERHRKNGPAIEYSNGIKYWFLNGKLHREDGPAIEYHDHKRWYINHERIPCTTQKQFERLMRLKAFW